MKLTIEKKFTDKYTRVKYEVGDKIEFADERAAELLADNRQLVSLAEPKEAEKPVTEEKPKTEPKPKAKKQTKKQ